MATPSVASTSTGLTGATRTTSSIPVPSGVVAGSLIFAALYIESTTAITPPAGGWTEITFGTSPFTTGTVTGQRWFWKYATGADSGTYDFTHASAWTSGGAVRILDGPTTGTPYEAQVGAQRSSNGTTTPAVSTTTTGPDRLLLFGATNSQTADFTPPIGATENFDGTELEIANKAQATAGATGSITATSTVTAFQTAALIPVLPASSNASGTLTVTGSGTTTFGATPNTSGSIARTGSGALTLTPTLIGGQGGTLAVTGSGTTTFGGTPRPAGVLARTGSGSLTLGQAAAAASGMLARTGSGDLTLTGLGFGTLTVTGSGTLTLATVSAGARGTLAATGSGLLTLAAAAVSAGGALVRTGAGTLTLLGLVAVSGSLTRSGSGLLTLAGFGYIPVPWAEWSGTEWVEIHPEVWDGNTWLEGIPVRALT